MSYSHDKPHYHIDPSDFYKDVKEGDNLHTNTDQQKNIDMNKQGVLKDVKNDQDIRQTFNAGDANKNMNQGANNK
jgi:hypothetical protein